MNSENVNLYQAFCFRLYPSHAQASALDAALNTLRHVYNSLLNERKFVYETTGKGVSQYAQEKHFAGWRKQFSGLAEVHSHLLQNAALRVNLAYAGFFRRVKNGDTPGFPRPKGQGQYDSLGFKEWGNGISFKRGNLYVSKIGEIRGKFHRKVEGTPKTATLRRRGDKWFVCISCEVSPKPPPPCSDSIGLDAGLNSFLALSNGEFVDNPRFFRRDEKALVKAVRRQAKTKKRSQERRKANKVLFRIHERIRNRRHDFVHQTARRIVDGFGVIAVEKLSIKNMLGNHCLAKSISDASWAMFRSVLTSKAESASREIYAVDPAYTSQDCSVCGYRTKKKLSERWHFCPNCSASLDRDINAAINILNRCGITQRGRYTVPEAVGH